MKKLLIATKNPGKLQELKKFLSSLPLRIVSLSDVGIADDVEETGITYKENSVKKALFYAKKSGLATIADDGGLEISALNNKPGVHSRRWLGHHASDEEIIAHTTKVARELPDNNRKAWFKVVISFALANGKVWSVSSETEGIIAKKPKVQNVKGFPFRHFFYLPKINKYYQDEELTKEEQKIYNHRFKAIEKLKPLIKKYI